MSDNDNDSEWCLEQAELGKLPANSACTEWKDAPARSAYWRDDTDSVKRCANFDTGGSSGSSGSDGSDSDKSDDSDDDGTAPPDRGDGSGDSGGGGGDGGNLPDHGDCRDDLVSGNMDLSISDGVLTAEASTGNKQWVAHIQGTDPTYDYERDFIAYQKPKTSNRDSGTQKVSDGDIIEYVRYTHSGKNRSESYYVVKGEQICSVEESAIQAYFRDGGSDDGEDDGEDIPDSVDAWSRAAVETVEEAVDPTWDVEYGWHYGGARPSGHSGEAWVYVLDAGGDSKTTRYSVKAEGEQMGVNRIGGADETDEAVLSAVDYMETHDPTTPVPDFDVSIPNAILKPLGKTANRLGTGAEIEVTDAEDTEGGFRTLRVIAGGPMTRFVVQIPTKQITGDLGDNGRMSVTLNGLYKVVNNTNKSESVRVETDHEATGKPKLRVHGTGSRSTEIRRSLQPIQLPKKGPSDGHVTTTGRNYKHAVKALGPVISRDDSAVAVHAGNGARLIAENPGGERARAPLDLTDDEPYNVVGNGTAGVEYKHLNSSSKSIQRPASTAVSLYVYDNNNGDGAVTVEYTDENCRFTHYLHGGEEIEDYDLSQVDSARRLSRCLSDPDAMKLHEPLQTGEQVPENVANQLDTDGDTVVWFFPNTDGCRCGTQAQQLDQLSAEHGTTVYGVANDPAADLKRMSDKLELGITLISDESGRLAEQFGVEEDGGGFERRIFFIRDGQVNDVSDGVASAALEQAPDCPNWGVLDPGNVNTEELVLEQAGEDKLFEVINHPGVYLVTGKRGSGKSSLAMRAAEGLYERDDITPVTVGMPAGAHSEFPDHWRHVDTLDNVPSNAVVVVDEAYAKFHARDAMSDENKAIGQMVNTSRHCQQTFLFVAQNSAHLDKGAPSEADGLLMKEPGTFHMEFERPQFRDLSETAKASFEQLPENMNRQEYVYAYTDEYTGMIRNSEADWYNDDVSRSFSASCTTNNG